MEKRRQLHGFDNTTTALVIGKQGSLEMIQLIHNRVNEPTCPLHWAFGLQSRTLNVYKARRSALLSTSYQRWEAVIAVPSLPFPLRRKLPLLKGDTAMPRKQQYMFLFVSNLASQE